MYTKKENVKFNKKKFLKDLIFKIQEDNITMLASQTTFNLIVALVPFLIIVINVILIFASSQIHVIQEYINTLPTEVANLGHSVLNFILSQKSTGVLSLGVLTAFWTSSRGVKALLISLNRAFDLNVKKSFIYRQIKGIIFTFVILIVIVTLLLGLVFGDLIITGIVNFFNINVDIVYTVLINFLRVVVPFVLMIISFTCLYLFGPNAYLKSLPPLIPCFIGGIIATLSITVITFGYAYYIKNISNMASVYGPLVGIMILFLWMYYLIISIIFAGEVSAALIRHYYNINYKDLDNYNILKKISKKDTK